MFRRQFYYLVSIILALITTTQVLGWITLFNSYLYEIQSCQYDMRSRLRCGGLDYVNQDKQQTLLICPGISSDQCSKAKSIITMLITAQILPIAYKGVMIFMAGCFLCWNDYQGCYGRCIVVLWFLVYTSVAIMLFVGAGDIVSLSNENVRVDSQLIGVYISLGIITVKWQLCSYSLKKQNCIIFLVLIKHICSHNKQLSQTSKQILTINKLLIKGIKEALFNKEQCPTNNKLLFQK